MLDGDLKNTSKHSKHEFSLGRAFEINNTVYTLLCWALETHRTCNVLLGCVFETQQCYTYLSFKVSKDSKCYTLLAWPAAHIVNSMSCSAELSKTQSCTLLSSGVSKDIQSYTLFAELPNTQQMPYLDGLSLCKHSQYNVLLGRTFENTEHATFISLLHSLHCFGLC